MFNLKNLFSLSYWFSLQPPLMRQTSYLMALALFLVLLIAAIVLWVIGKKKRGNPPLSHFFRRLSYPFLFLSIIGFIFLFFRYEIIYFLGARFWFLLLGLGFLVWLALVIVRFLKTYKKEVEQIEKEREFRKYLP